MARYIQVFMPDGSVWEVPYKPLIQLSIKQGVTKGQIDPEDAKEYERSCLEDIVDPAQVHDDLIALSWTDVAPHAIQVKPPDSPPYSEWWKESNAFNSFRFVENEPMEGTANGR